MTASSSSPTLLAKTVSTTAGVTHIDLNFSATMAKGRGSIFVTDGAVQTVIDRATGEPKLRVVGATFTKEIPLSQVAVNGSHVSFDAAGLAGGKHYSIFMGAGTLTSGGSPFAGYTVPNQVAFDVAAAPSGLSASFAFENTSLKAGQDIEVFVTLSQSVASLDASAFSAENASVLSVTGTDDPRIWKVVLTRSTSVADAENVLRLDLTKVETAPGVHGSGTATSSNYTVDTLVGSWISKAGSGWDTGVSDEDNLVHSTSPYITGELHGGLDEGDTIELFINGTAVDPERIEVIRETSPWMWSYSPGEGEDEPFFNEGPNTIEVRVKNGEHTSATYTSTITVDTAQPEIEISPDGATALPLNADIVITFKEPLFWANMETDMMPISVYCAEDDYAREVYVDASAFLDGGSILTLDPAELGLEAGKHYELRLPDYLTDYAGNSLANALISFQTSGTPDLTPPSATHAIVDGSLFYKAGDTITFRIKFDENIRPASDAILWVGLSNGYRADIASIDGDEMTFTYTVDGVDSDIGNLTITDTTLLVDNIEDLAGNPLTNAHIVFDGIHQYLGYGYGYLPVNVVVDTVAPDAPSAPTLDAGSDSGALGDNITNDRTPTLKGSAEARAWISIHEGGTVLGGVRADESGNWEIDVSELGAGLHNLTIVQTDRAGNDSSGTDFGLTIDYSAASLAQPALANDTGVSASDRITTDTTLAGSGAEANAHIKIMSGEDIVGVGTADADGNWTAVFGSSLPDGEHSYTVRQVDAAGNTSADSPAITFTVDRSAPGVPSGAPDLAAASDSGAFDNDNITSEREPTFNGSGALANTGVALFANGVEIGRTAADPSGNWTFKVPSAKALGDGIHAITVRQFDAAGNMSGDSMPLSITVDNVGPSAGVASVNVHGRKFALPFSEAIVFQPSGRFNLLEGGMERDAYWGNNNNSSWSVTADTDGELSILNFNISLNGLLRMQWNNGSVTDLAGNAAIVGVAGWDFEMPTTS